MKLLVLAVVLGLVALTVPDSSVAPTQFSLVSLDHAASIDPGSKVIWVLAVGSDARPGEDMTRTRGDALQLIGINTRSNEASAIGVPRDSWVNIPGVGFNKINSALYYGGPKLLGETVGNLVGIQPDYVFVTRFENFSRMIDNIGGIQVDNPIAFDDQYLKEKGFPKGKIHLNGYTAMAFSRIRHNLLRGDFDRSANQQRTIRGIQQKVRIRARQPGFIESNVMAVMRNMDTTMSPSQLFELAHAVAQVDPTKITTCVVQGSIGNIGGASVVLPFTDQAARMGDLARNDASIESCD